MRRINRNGVVNNPFKSNIVTLRGYNRKFSFSDLLIPINFATQQRVYYNARNHTAVYRFYSQLEIDEYIFSSYEYSSLSTRRQNFTGYLFFEKVRNVVVSVSAAIALLPPPLSYSPPRYIPPRSTLRNISFTKIILANWNEREKKTKGANISARKKHSICATIFRSVANSTRI